MDFGAIRDTALLVLMFIVFGVPAVALAARLAIRPVVDAIVRFRESFAATHSLADDTRLAALEADMSRLRQEVRLLSDAEAFNRQLIQATASSAEAGPASPRIQAEPPDDR